MHTYLKLPNLHGIVGTNFHVYRFMVGTETGLVIGGNRKGKNAVEKLPSKVSNLAEDAQSNQGADHFCITNKT